MKAVQVFLYYHSNADISLFVQNIMVLAHYVYREQVRVDYVRAITHPQLVLYVISTTQWYCRTVEKCSIMRVKAQTFKTL